jgi:outer membrane protein
MKKAIKFLAPLALVASASAHADFIGGTVEASYWYGGISGDATAGTTTVDFEDHLNFEEDSFFEFAASFEHPVPLIPNVKLRYTAIDQNEEGNILGAFDGIAAGNVETTLNLSHLDVIAYYEILDNWVSVDIGFDIKAFDGELEVKGGGLVSTTPVDEFLPLPYAKAEVELPFTGMALGAELSGLAYDGNGLYDARVRFRQNIAIAFVELGYRSMGIKIEDLSGDVGDIDVDVNFSGVYLSTGLDF